jgi:molybdate transport system substrate-binding protein
MGTSQAVADELKVAVASNFYPTMKVIAKRYELKTAGSSGQQHKVILIPGSSGKHYAQIMNGAPFDIFFSADTERARLLEQEGKPRSSYDFSFLLQQSCSLCVCRKKYVKRGTIHDLGVMFT